MVGLVVDGLVVDGLVGLVGLVDGGLCGVVVVNFERCCRP